MLQRQIVDGFQFQGVPVQPLDFDVFVIGNFEVFQDLMQATTKPKAAHRVQPHAKYQHRAQHNHFSLAADFQPIFNLAGHHHADRRWPEQIHAPDIGHVNLKV